ncbi:hypothetical protein SORBI_3010G223800 [Sorghum bicolor]|uniref:Ubiquitin-like protease family profile domain-containing protein n=1 Tax=Sorghum bicolor TaxID=4558 RepID=A0A194YKS9_SORBI|nr:hypothetical protein SORBI_3010G223800 [Sorghum bicolor]
MSPMGGLGCSAQQVLDRGEKIELLVNKTENMRSQDYLSATHIKVMQEFVEFCKSKISNQDNNLSHHLKKNLNTVKEDRTDSYNFKEKLILYFGDYLPAKVINELCALVHDNSYGEIADKNAHVFANKISNPTKDDHDEADTTMHKSAKGNTHTSMVFHSGRIDKENFISSREATHNNGAAHPDKNECMNKSPPTDTQNQTKTKDAFDNLMVKVKNIISVLDTPIVMNNNSCYRTEFFSQPETFNPMNKRIKLERPISHMSAPASHDHVNVVIDVDEIQNKDFTSHESSRQNAKVSCDQIYNRKNFPSSEIRKKVDTGGVNFVGNKPINMSTKTITIGTPQCSTEATSQFHVTDEERRYYDIFCGLARSQWKCFPAVKFLKTSVTYSSFGESVEPKGLVDNFFIAGCCRKMFEDHHPRRSKKHYFYPHVGGCLLTYNSQYDINVVKNSFHGANSAHKLHLSEKLCFPVWKQEHWFVFIVDLRNKMFVFLDSYYDRDDYFQTCARDSLITSFTECWYEHADVKLDLGNFTIQYPPVPKQENKFDCGIFTIKFMELWDNSVDLRRLFSQSDIPNIRIKLAMKLFFSKSNSVDMSLVRTFYEEGIDPRLCN